GPREAWARSFAGGDPSVEAILLDPLADPDGDGRPNLMEYALGLSPLDPQDAPALIAGMDSGSLTFTYTRRTPAAALMFVVEFSADLTAWEAGGTTLATVPGSGGETITVRAPSPAHHFARLRVAIAP